MGYLFNIVGVSPILYFFEQQQELSNRLPKPQVEYVSSMRCTLDAVLESIEEVPQQHGWELDEVVDSVVQFWIDHLETIEHWKQRLSHAGQDSVLVSQIGDLSALRQEFDFLFDR